MSRSWKWILRVQWVSFALCLCVGTAQAQFFGEGESPSYTPPRLTLPNICSMTSELQGHRNSSRKSGGDTWVGKGTVECVYPFRATQKVQVCYFDWESQIYDHPSMNMGSLLVEVISGATPNGIDSFMGEFELYSSQLNPSPELEAPVTILMGTGSEQHRVSQFLFGAEEELLTANSFQSGMLVITPEDTPCQDYYDITLSVHTSTLGSL